MGNMNEMLANKEFYKILVSVLALVLSICNTVYLYITQRCKISIQIRRFSIRQYERHDIVNVYFEIENHSRLPIAISRMRLIVDDVYYETSIYPEMYAQRFISNTNADDEKIKYYSTPLPLNIIGLGAFSGYIAFVVPPGTVQAHDKLLNLEVNTNRKGLNRFAIQPREGGHLR